MAESYKTKSLCVVDNGLFVELAVTLAKSFGKVYYHSPWTNAFPRMNELVVGSGIEGVERVDNLFDIVGECDLFCFPDIYHGDLQLYLENQGHRVWGSRHGDELEIYRDAAKKHFMKLGLPVIKYEVCVGMDALRKYLKEHDNVWIKLEKSRGDCESFHSPNYRLIEPKLDELEHNLGAVKYVMKWIVEDSVDDSVETGWDGFCIDGQYPQKSFCGVEVKDKGYCLVVKDTAKMPEPVMQFNQAIAPTLKQYHYRNFLSTEVRIGRESEIGKFNITKNGLPLNNGLIGFMNDCCSRAGSPPNEIYQNQIENLADIIWSGAEGKLVEPECKFKFGAELLIHSAWADKNWQAIHFPKEIRDYVKLRNLAIIKGEYYVVPQSVGCPEVGAVIGLGSTIEEAVEQCKEYAEQVEGYYLDVFPECLDQAQEEIDKLTEMGINIMEGV